jgi:hypothetical protein
MIYAYYSAFEADEAEASAFRDTDSTDDSTDSTDSTGDVEFDGEDTWAAYLDLKRRRSFGQVSEDTWMIR